MISLIVAASSNGVIGADNSIPWHVPEDFKYFKETTIGKPIIMGRKTWESLPKKPLPDRKNIVITSDDSIVVPHRAKDIDQAIQLAKEGYDGELMVIGGASIYAQFLPMADRIYFTKVHCDVEGDTYFPSLNGWKVVSENTILSSTLEVSFIIYEK